MFEQTEPMPPRLIRPGPLGRLLLLAMLLSLVTGCGMHQLPNEQKAVQTAWQKLRTAYGQRAERVPDLLATVRRHTSDEQDALASVADAKARATAFNVDADTLEQPHQMASYIQAEEQLGGALAALLANVGNAPGLTADPRFQTLTSRLNAATGRIARAQRDYLKAIKVYNDDLTTLPGRFWHMLLYRDMRPYDNFEATSLDAEQTSQIQF